MQRGISAFIIALIVCLSFSVRAENVPAASVPGHGPQDDILWFGEQTGVPADPFHSFAPALFANSEAWQLMPPALVVPPIKKTARSAAPLQRIHKHPVIALVIDDMGVDHRRSARAVRELPPEVTLSFLPYGANIRQQVVGARKKGHQILAHIPMEPDSAAEDPGPDYLGLNMADDEIRKRLKKNLDAFGGYVGVNNHMGSKFTHSPEKMAVVMDELKKRKLFFLDSKTAADSVGEKVAREYGLSTTHRDVFLDNVETADSVALFLSRTEDVARKTGSVVAIGHPRDITLKALAGWIPALKEKGYTLVPLSAVINFRAKARVPALVEEATVAAAENNPAPEIISAAESPAQGNGAPDAGLCEISKSALLQR